MDAKLLAVLDAVEEYCYWGETVGVERLYAAVRDLLLGGGGRLVLARRSGWWS